MQYFRSLFFILVCCSAFHGIWVLWHYHYDRWPSDLYNRPLEIEGTITSLPRQNNNAEQFWFQTKEGLIQLNWYYPFPELKPGEKWRLQVKLKPNSFQNNPGEFDYGSYLRAEGVLASGYVMTKIPPSFLGKHPWQTPIETLRFYVYQHIIAATNGLAMQGILVALILGDKTLLNARQWQVFSASGTSYFMVISGLHIVLLATMGGLLARYFWSFIPRAPLFIPAQKIGLLAGLGFGLVYSLLAGFPVPTQRALFMLWLMGLAKLLLERIHSMTLLFIACLTVLAWNPLSLYSVAFWLSFIAVFFLIYILSSRYRPLTKWQEWIYPQWVMYCCLMPILIYVFHEFSVISLVTNFIAMPFMMLAVIPLALLGGMTLFIYPALGHLLFVVSNLIMSWLWMILAWATNLPHAILHLAEPSLTAVILSLCGCLLLFAPQGVPLRLLSFFLFLPLFIPTLPMPTGKLKITSLHVNEGSVSIFATNHGVIVEQNLVHLREAKLDIREVIEPYLQTHGYNEITLWIVNGAKTYHALQSLENAWQATRIDKIILPHPLKTFDSAIMNCEIPQNFQMSGIQFTVSLQAQGCILKKMN